MKWNPKGGIIGIKCVVDYMTFGSRSLFFVKEKKFEKSKKTGRMFRQHIKFVNVFEQ